MSHPQVQGALSTEKCAAYESGCPFNNTDSHPHILSQSQLQELQQKCPAFKDGACPFSSTSDKHPTVKTLADASKCPAFQDGCAFSAGGVEDLHPDVSKFWSVDANTCKAMQNGCPFKNATLSDKDPRADDICPFLAGWHKSLHPSIYSLSHSAECEAFKTENGCPFRAESRDDLHRLFGLDDEAIQTIKTKCPAFSTGVCPFAPSSTSHPKVTNAADLKRCPAFKDGGCVFNTASKASTSAHPNIGKLFKKPLSTCSAFKHGCPFVTLGHEKPSELASIEAAKKKCPAFKEHCPFVGVKTFGEFAARWSEVPSSHFDLISGSHQMVAYLMQSVRRAVKDQDQGDEKSQEMPAGHPTIPPAALEKIKAQYPGMMEKGQCPFGGAPSASETGSRKRKRSNPSLSAIEFAHVFSRMYAQHGKSAAAGSCPAFKDGCTFKNIREGKGASPGMEQQPLTEVVSKCPAFENGRCPFSA